MRLLLFWTFASLATCQTFEVASIKTAAPATGHMQFHMTLKVDGSRVDALNASLADLIQTAYRVNSYQVQGPAWIATQKFDIQAKIPDGASKDQVPEMFLAMLIERFKLSMHRSSVEHAAYALITAKGDLKLKESPPEGNSAWTRTFAPDGSMRIDTRNMTLPALAALIARFMDYPVVDMTGIDGKFDVPLNFSPEDLRTGSKSAGVQVEGPSTASGTSAIFDSVQQLGLKLVSRKLPIDLIAVDHIEKMPTAN
jgi:uncharacterized protein (TIGR03435 family)